MKKFLMYPSFLLLAFSACKNKNRQSEREYGALFEKEYAEVAASEQYKTFRERYELLVSLSKEVARSEEMEITEPEKADTLCFIPPEEQDLQFEQNYTDEKAGKTGAKAFSDRINLSKEVNAAIVAENFYNKESLASVFEHESGLHEVYFLSDKTQYLALLTRTQDTVQAYERLCDDRRMMDRINNSRYFLFQKDIINSAPEYDKETDNDEFTGGAYIGEVYVYDIVKKKFIYSFPVSAASSDQVEGRKKWLESEVSFDFNGNINKNLEKQIQLNFGLRGGVPNFLVTGFPDN